MKRRSVLAALVLLAAPLLAQEKVSVRRLSDVVAVRQGAAAVERVLYYFNPTAELAEGDQVEQGSAGHSEIIMNGGAIVTLHSSNHVIVDTLAADGDRLEIPLVTRLECHVKERGLLLFLPGESTVELLNGDATVELEPGRLRIRNEGGQPVVVTGDMRPTRDQATVAEDGRVELGQGEEIRLVLVGGDVEQTGQLTDLWGAVAVRHDEDVQLQPDGAALRPRAAEGQPPEACRLTVRGVRTVPRAGLVVHNPLHVTLKPPPDTEPAPKPEPAAAPPAAEPQPTPQPTPPDQVPPPAPADEGKPKSGSSGGGSR
jgi:hypothetical protein